MPSSQSRRFPGLSRPVVCDVLVFLTALFLNKPVRRLLEAGTAGFDESGRAGSAVLGWLLGASMAGYSLGCWLKRGGLQQRLDPPGTAGCFLTAWFSLMVSLTIFGAAVVMTDLNMDSGNGWHMLLLFVVALTPVIFGLLAMIKGNPAGFPWWRRHPVTEIAGDVLIIAAILPVTLLWQEWISSLFTQHLKNEGWGMRLFAAGMGTFGFALFYCAPRLVLVYENVTDKFTWLSFALAASPMLWACLFP